MVRPVVGQKYKESQMIIESEGKYGKNSKEKEEKMIYFV
jgi:hypothetical protein